MLVYSMCMSTWLFTSLGLCCCFDLIECRFILSGCRWDFVRRKGGDVWWMFCSVTHERRRLSFPWEDRRRFEEWLSVNERALEMDSEALATTSALLPRSDEGVDKPEHDSKSNWQTERCGRRELDAEWVMNGLILSLEELWLSSLSSESFGSSWVNSFGEDFDVELVFLFESRKLFERRNKRIVSIRSWISLNEENECRK